MALRCVKFLESGSSLMKPSAQNKHIKPSTAIETRQEKISVSSPIPTRPIIPPNAVPAIYSPIVLLRSLGFISSAIHAIATAGTPPNTKPSMLLEKISICQLGEIAQIIFKSPAKNIEQNISPFLPSTWENALDSIIENARNPVVIDKASALALGAI